MSVPTIPDVDTPEAVVDAARRLRAYGLEFRTLANTDDTRPSVTRRAGALRLLVADTRTELLATVGTHKPAWSEAIAARLVDVTAAYTDAIGRLDAARRDMNHAGSVLGWLANTRDAIDARILAAYTGPGAIRLDNVEWSGIVGALYTDAGATPVARPDPVIDSPRFGARSLAPTTATFPALDMPDPLLEPYQRHRRLLAEHRALSDERDRVERGRFTAEAADHRALADAIVAGNDDPGDTNTAALDATLDTLDTRRGLLAIDVTDSQAELRQLLDTHHDTWQATVQARLDADLDAYATAVGDVTATRAQMHGARQAAAWLDATTPTELGKWRHKDQPQINGEPWDVMARLLRRDVAQHRPAAAAVGGDAA